jgi:molecular chaperone DnaK
MENNVVGIDLGTTFSAIAVVENGEPHIINNIEGQEITPSAVLFVGGNNEGKDEYLVGAAAKAAASTSPKDMIQFIKRQIGCDRYTFESQNGTSYTPEMISALILKKLKQDAELYLGEGSVKEAVITVPAYFDDARRTATIQAGKIAGLDVLRVINEPTAAAIAFGVDSTGKGKVLVYDLGGGTFDVTLMEINGGQFDVIATKGDRELGGINFDQKIVAIMVQDLESQGAKIDILDDALSADIREKAEIVKIRLTNTEVANNILFNIDGKAWRTKVTREQFESAAKPLLERTQLILEDVLKAGEITWNEIDHLLMVGGSTKMPIIKRTLENISGKSLTYKVHPDTAVAIGAAILASTLRKGKSNTSASTSETPPANVEVESQKEDASEHTSEPQTSSTAPDITISDVTSQSLGVVALDDDGREVNSVIIAHDTKIPAHFSRRFWTTADNQTRIELRVTEGNDPDLEFVKIVGKSMLQIPPHPKNSPVEVIYAYDADQTISIEVIDRVTDESLGTFAIERSSNMTEEQVTNAIRIISDTNVD